MLARPETIMPVLRDCDVVKELWNIFITMMMIGTQFLVLVYRSE
jgi:hypothetical protein